MQSIYYLATVELVSNMKGDATQDGEEVAHYRYD